VLPAEQALQLDAAGTWRVGIEGRRSVTLVDPDLVAISMSHGRDNIRVPFVANRPVAVRSWLAICECLARELPRMHPRLPTPSGCVAAAA